uniref:Uncharacterized protein n=1 Tax=Solanum tuberosum TaxID=4113 RepID=M1DZP9_SOLTU
MGGPKEFVLNLYSLSSKNSQPKKEKAIFKKELKRKNTYSKDLINRRSASPDHSATLVRIADQLGDSPLDVVHRRLAPSFSIVVLWVIGRHSTASLNFSAMHRLLPFFAYLILSFKAQHTGTKGKVRPFGDLPSGLGNPQAFIFFILLSPFVPFCEVASMLSFKLQIPKTYVFSSDIEIK